jgi:cell wall-associated NlpC family hydrolase
MPATTCSLRMLVKRALSVAAIGSALGTAAIAETALPAQAVAVPSAVAVASSYAGVPYAFGGTSPKGFDCSGFVQYVFSRIGISLPRTTDAQYAVVEHLRHSQRRPGDILFVPDGRGGVEHEGIYAGGNTWWVARHTGTVVMLQQLYMGDNYLVGRVRGAAGAAAASVARTAQAKGQDAPRSGARSSGLHDLQEGSSGADVAALQRRLHLVADGAFGPQTRGAVQAAQRNHHLLADGIVGPATRKALRL